MFKQFKKGAKLYGNGCLLGTLIVMLRNIDTGKDADGIGLSLYVALFGLTVIVSIWLLGNIRDYYSPD